MKQEISIKRLFGIAFLLLLIAVLILLLFQYMTIRAMHTTLLGQDTYQLIQLKLDGVSNVFNANNRENNVESASAVISTGQTSDVSVENGESDSVQPETSSHTDTPSTGDLPSLDLGGDLDVTVDANIDVEVDISGDIDASIDVDINSELNDLSSDVNADVDVDSELNVDSSGDINTDVDISTDVNLDTNVSDSSNVEVNVDVNADVDTNISLTPGL